MLHVKPGGHVNSAFASAIFEGEWKAPGRFRHRLRNWPCASSDTTRCILRNVGCAQWAQCSPTICQEEAVPVFAPEARTHELPKACHEVPFVQAGPCVKATNSSTDVRTSSIHPTHLPDHPSALKFARAFPTYFNEHLCSARLGGLSGTSAWGVARSRA